MKGIWGTSYGFPGPIPVEPFKDYIRANEYVANHYYNAYPGLDDDRDHLGRQGGRGARRPARPRAVARPGRVQGRLRGHADRRSSTTCEPQRLRPGVRADRDDADPRRPRGRADRSPRRAARGRGQPARARARDAPRPLGGDRPGQVPGPRAAPPRLARRGRACCSPATSTASSTRTSSSCRPGSARTPTPSGAIAAAIPAAGPASRPGSRRTSSRRRCSSPPTAARRWSRCTRTSTSGRALIEFALEAQGLEPEALKARFLEAF